MSASHSHGPQPRSTTPRPANGEHRSSSPSPTYLEGHSPRPPAKPTSLPPLHPATRSSSPSPSHPLRHSTLTSRAPLPSPPSHPPTLISLPVPSGPPPPTAPPPAPAFKSRRFLLLLTALTLTSLPLFYVVSLFSTFCPPSSSPSSSGKPPPLTLLSPHSSSSSLTPFLLPHPTPTLYVSSHPDPSSSLSSQFAQWLYGPYLALHLNLSYAHTPFLKLSSRWTTFLGFGQGETTEADLLAVYARTRLFVRNVEGGGGEGEGGERGGDVVEWVKDKRRKVESINKQLTDWTRRVQLNPELAYPKVDEPKGAVLDGYHTTHIDPANPITTATVFRLYRLPVPSLMHACHPPLLLLLRRKYCAARVRSPLPVDLYGEDRRAGHMIVALHVVCGDACYNGEKSFPLASYAASMSRLTAVAAAHRFPPPCFHVFTTQPSNDSSPTFFSSADVSCRWCACTWACTATRCSTTWWCRMCWWRRRWAAASTSWLVQLMHHGVVVGPAVPQHACTGRGGHVQSRDGERSMRTASRQGVGGGGRAQDSIREHQRTAHAIK